MGYDLGCYDPEELAYYNKLRKEMDDMKKKLYLLIGISQMAWVNESEYFFNNRWETYAYCSGIADNY